MFKLNVSVVFTIFQSQLFPKYLKKLNDIAYKMLQMSHKRLNLQMLRYNSYKLISYKSQVYVFYYNQEQKIKLYAINYIYYYIYNIYSNLYSASIELEQLSLLKICLLIIKSKLLNLVYTLINFVAIEISP